MSKRKSTFVVAFAVMGVVALGLAAAVYAKYVADNINKTGTASVAKWAFSQDNTTGTLSCLIPNTYNSGTLVNGKIAPGTSGTCEIAVSNEHTEVGVNYTVTVSSISGLPANFVLKNGNTVLGVNDSVAGVLAPGQTDGKVTINWEWPYGTGVAAEDAEDTTDGVNAGNMSVVFTISGHQIQPTQ